MTRELRLALLAAMETCWVFAVVVFLAAQIGKPRALTPLPFFVAYWLALVVGRVLPQSRKQWLTLQVTALVIVAVTVLAVIRVELFAAFEWYDLAWLPHALSTILLLSRGIATEHLVTAGVLYVFVRGLGFAQRPLTLWFVGFQFRLGIVVFFALFAMARFARPFIVDGMYDPTVWIFVYFVVSLCAIALARIEEMGGAVQYTPRWAVTILGGIALVLFVGFAILQFFSPETARWLLQPFTLIGWLVVGIIMLLAIPFSYLAGWLVELLKPIFERMARALQDLTNLMPPQAQETLKHAPESPVWIDLASIAQMLVVPGALLIVAYFLLRALNRRMKQIEDEAYVREAIGAEEDADRSRRGALKKSRPPRSCARHITAESIRRIYAALVARAADAGVTRRVAETPYEFLPRLTAAFSDQSDDIRAITEAYVAVHYAEVNATPETAAHVRVAWQRVESGIRLTQKR